MSRFFLWVLGFVIWLAYLASAHASVPINEFQYRVDIEFSNAAWWPTATEACNAAIPRIKAQVPGAATVTFIACSSETLGYQARAFNAAGDDIGGWNGTLSRRGMTCPANSTPNGGGTCECTAPYVENSTHTSCVTPPSAWEQACNSHAGQSAGPGDWSGNSSQFGCAAVPGGGTATQGCLVSGSGTGVKYQPTPGNWITSNSNTTYTGATCVPNVDAPAASRDQCPGGQSGTVNGKARCVPLDPTIPAEQTRETSTTNPDGSTTTTTESTSCNAGKCTTTTTNTTTGGSGGGGGTSTSSTTEGIGDYCKKNPQTALCAKTNNGQTATTGDDKSDGECDSKSTVIGCAKFGTPPADQQIPKDTKTVGLGTSPVQGFGAVCPAPNTFVVAGQSFTISYQPLCDKASWIKPLVLLVAGFISLGIVYGALKGA